MNSTGANAAEQPSPAAALEQRFQAILQTQMHDVPMVNPALCVQAVGFRPWAEHWLGVLITPWFMNLMLLPRLRERWPSIGERESRHYVFPAGVFEFIGGRDPALGDYQACSLFSPMFEFPDQAAAHDTAVAVLEALFDRAHREAGEVLPLAQPTAGETAALAAQPPQPRAVSKRDFLFGPAPRGDRGP